MCNLLMVYFLAVLNDNSDNNRNNNNSIQFNNNNNNNDLAKYRQTNEVLIERLKRNPLRRSRCIFKIKLVRILNKIF
jgi:hypothetical protein